MVLISVREGVDPQGHSGPEGFSMKNSNGTIGNRTRDLPACIAVPQPSAPPAACRVTFVRVLILMITEEKEWTSLSD